MTTFEATLRGAAAAAIGKRTRRFVHVAGSVVALEIQSGGKYGPGTPMDTGFARAGWNAALDADPPEAGPAERINEPGAHAGDALASEGRIQEVTAGMAVGQMLVLANRVEYINDLNNGKSGQAPEGMTEPVGRQFQRLVDEVVAFVAQEA